MIRKVGRKYGIYHCTGKDKGKLIKKFNTKKDALAMHRAIEISKKKKGK